MKKLLVLFVFIGFFAGGSLKADNMVVKVFGGIGLGASDFRNFNVTVGGELNVTKRFSVIGSFDYFFSPDNEKKVQGRDVDSYAYYLGLYLKYKLAGPFFVKAGVNYSRYKLEYLFDTGTKSWSIPATYKDTGISGGVGLDFPLGKKTNLQFGVDTCKTDMFSWLKFYGTIGFRII